VSIFVAFLTWYFIVQLASAAALPLTLRFFRNLPDRGYVFTKILGPFLIGVTLWLGTSYGLLRNEAGGAWISLGIVAGVSYGFGGYRLAVNWVQEMSLSRRRAMIGVEALFVAAFAVWTWVRVNDPAANHTEQPMDLMFMNSIWVSPVFPPRDAWLAGYPISYYYLGYWLLTTLGRLANMPPALAYTIGQASWYGLLLTGSFGVVYNLAALDGTDQTSAAASEPGQRRRAGWANGLAGLSAAAFVGVIGNLQGVLEWLYAQGANIGSLAAWLDVNGFPENAQRSGLWYIGYDWWWWRSSRVIADRDLTDRHLEVIDEFPAFSYILGDNHPHVLAMPVALVVIAMALSVYLSARHSGLGEAADRPVWSTWRRLPALLPMGWFGLSLIAAVSGGLVFLNTWDYPPYWLLLTAALFAGLVTSEREVLNRVHVIRSAAVTAAFGVLLVAGALVMCLPFLLTAQSQARGFLPNLFNPTRLQQALLMFGVFMPVLAGWLAWMWRSARPPGREAAIAAGLVFGLPIAFLGVSIVLAVGTPAGQTLLQRMTLPDGATSHLPFIVQRWTRQPFTFLVFGALLAATLALIWRAATSAAWYRPSSRVALFVLLLTAVGLALVFAPEFVYLRDNFGTRMNTVFKFYYQAWLLLALVSGYAVAAALAERDRAAPRYVQALCLVTIVLAMATMIYPVAGTYSKTLGFSAQPRTADATHYLAREGPSEKAATEWVQYNTSPDALVLEGKGASYWSNYNRISTMTGRSTLLGWDGHESQWRGEAYGEMARGRVEALESVYRSGSPAEIERLLSEWGIDFVYIGPTERQQYAITPRSEERIAAVMDLVFSDGDVRIFRRR